MPTYCTAQEVINFLGILGDDNSPLELSETTDPKLSFVEDIIDDEEAELENRTGHAWKILRAETEDLDFPQQYDWFFGAPIHLRHRHIQPIDGNAGDSVGIWLPNGTYEDWTDHEIRRWKLNTNMGIFYVLGYIWWSTRENRIRIKYRYGETEVPRWVRRCMILMVSSKLIETSINMSRVSTVSGDLPKSELLSIWNRDIERAIGNNSEWVTVPYGS